MVIRACVRLDDASRGAYSLQLLLSGCGRLTHLKFYYTVKQKASAQASERQ